MSSSQSKKSVKRRRVPSFQTSETVDLEDLEGGDDIGEQLEEEDDEITPTSKSYTPHPTRKARPGRRYVKKDGKRRASYWVDYDLYLDVNENLRAECLHCGVTFAADSVRNGTKNLKKHSEACEKNPKNQGKSKQSILHFVPVEGEDGEVTVKHHVVSQEEFREILTKMIVMDEMPFRQVEKGGFRYFCDMMLPTYKLPSRWTVSRDCYKFYLGRKDKVKNLLTHSCQRVCITTDTWTSIQKINYMCVTAHFIDDNWKLQKRVINFCPIGSHKGEAIGRAVEECLDSWGIMEKLFTVTVDNASSNDTACGYLKELGSDKSLIAHGKHLHMRCIAHILNLIVWDGLKEHKKCIDKVRYAILYIRASPARLALFKQQAENCRVECKLALSYDVPTRWNSTYTMLNTAIKYKVVFGRLKIPWDANDPNVGAPSVDEWVKIERLCFFLKEFYDLTILVSGSLYVTSNSLFFHIAHTFNLLKEFMNNDDENFRKMAISMKSKYDKYWGSIEKMNMLIYLGVILDPKYKLIGLQSLLCRMYGMEDGEYLGSLVEKFLYTLFAEYKSKYAPLAPQSGESGDRVSSSMASVIPSSQGSSALMDAIAEEVKLKTSGCAVGGENSSGRTWTELDRYLCEVKGDDEEPDILAWWKITAPRFPILARMARDVLAIPISTVASESVFSTGGRTLDPFRSSLSPKMAQGLICGQDWIRGEIHTPNVDEDSPDEMEKLERDMENMGMEDKTIYVVENVM